MVHQYLNLLPQEVSPFALYTLLATLCAGGVLWAAGAMFSRYVVTLLTVLLGAVAGMLLPRTVGWEISGAGPAVGGAVLLGVSGFILHGLWMGILLGLVLSLWVAMVTWISAGTSVSIDLAGYSRSTSLPAWCVDLWTGLPPTITRILPYSTATALVSGLACAIMWTRFTTAFAWSMVGATMMAGAGLAAARVGKPELIEQYLPQPAMQVAAMLGIVLIGVILQWKLAGLGKAKKKSKKGATKPSGGRPVYEDPVRYGASS
jgi:hypothetical protein